MNTQLLYLRNTRYNIHTLRSQECLSLVQTDLPFSTNNTADVQMTYQRSTFCYWHAVDIFHVYTTEFTVVIFHCFTQLQHAAINSYSCYDILQTLLCICIVC